MGATGKRAKRGAAIGIDLGTTYSCVGYRKGGQVEIIQNDQGNRITPSYVAFTDKDRFIGDAAFHQAALNPLNTVFDAKRLIGRNFSDETVQRDRKLWPFKVVSGRENRPVICVTYKGEEKQFVAEEISSMVLTKMKQIAEAFIGSEVKDAVVTVPAYFDQAQRQGTMDAGEIAGINILQLISEPTAAAIAYGLQSTDLKGRRGPGRKGLIFDLGGGTLDVSLLDIYINFMIVKTTCGDTHLGGQDFDNRLVDHYIKEFKAKHKKDISANPKSLRRLRTACERAKRILSSTCETRIEIDALLEGIDFSATLTRAKFEELNLDLFQTCMETVTRCLDDAKMKKTDVTDVVLVGGSSRIPKVQKLLQTLLDGKELCTSINPDEAVAYGAAVHASILSGHRKKNHDFGVLDVTPLSLGVETVGQVMKVVLPNNTNIPMTVQSRGYTTTQDYLEKIQVRVYEGQRARSIDNRLLGQFTLTGIELAPRGVPRITIYFDISGSGLLKVTAKDKVTGKASNITVKCGRLSEEEIEMMKAEANKFMAEDEMHMMKSKARGGLEDYACQMREAIHTLACPTQKKNVEDAVRNALQWLDARTELADLHQYERRMEELVNLWKPNSISGATGASALFTRFAKLFGLKRGH